MRVATLLNLILSVLLAGCTGGRAPSAEPAPKPERSRPAVTAQPKIIAFGDSLTSGFGLDSWEMAYPALLQKRLDAAGYDLQVLNYGQGGDTAEGGLSRLYLATGVANVRIFVLELGANDIMKGTPVSAIRANLAEIIRRLRERGIEILLCGYRAPESIDAGYRAEIDSMYRELADEYRLSLVPDFMEGVAGNPDFMQPDNIHPNENGTKVIEQKVFDAIEPMLVKYAPKN